jgi:hypothetical protein
MPLQPIIPDRAEFVDVLDLLRRGHELVQHGQCAGSALISGGVVYHSVPTLLRYGLLDTVERPDLPPGARCWRLSERGRMFADRAWREWRRKPLWQRVAVRLVG